LGKENTSNSILYKWNEFCKKNKNFEKILKLSGSRKEKINKRVKEGMTIENFEKVLEELLNSDFLKGEGQPKNEGEKPFFFRC